MWRPGEKGVSSTGIWGPAFYLYFVLWGLGGYRESGIFILVSSNILGLHGLCKGDRAPSPHEQRVVESLGWTTSAQTGQVAVPHLVAQFLSGAAH